MMTSTSELFMYGSALGAGSLATVACYPLLAAWWRRLAGRVDAYQHLRMQHATKVLDELFMDVKPTWLKTAYQVGPLGAGLILFILFNNLLMAGLGAAVGLVIPDLWVKQTRARRNRKFQAQLVDALFILSSSLKAGLSLTQAFEVLESEMPPPASQEFGLMIKAHRLGRTLEEALQSLNARMPSEELNLIITAILVARETGGDVTEIISRLITTIREKKKLGDKVRTLTLQGRLQAYIMSVLPLVFAMAVRTFNPRYFDLLLQDATGVMLLVVAGVLWLVGMVLLLRFSRVEV